MPKRPLIKGKPAFTKRFLIIELLMCTILTVMIMTGFSSGVQSDANIFTAEDQRIVMWQELPESGAPDEYDPVTNVKFVAQRLYTSPYFKGITEGDVKANLGMGIKYTQHVYNTRVVKGNTIFSEAVSSSTMKSVAEQKYFSGNTILFRPSASVSGNNATYSDNVTKFETSDYYAKYGVKPNELTKEHIMVDDPETEEDENTIISIRDNNASKAAVAARRNGDGTPIALSTLVADADGNYSVTMELDPYKSTIYSRNEVRTLAGADKNPLFHSVTITLKFDSAWRPISTDVVEVYDIEIPVIGAMTCTSALTETFSDVGKEDGVVPEQEFFEAHIEDAGEYEGGSQQLSPADYLSSAFAKYLSGEENLDLAADIAIGSVNINNLKLSVNIGTLDIKARLDKLYIQYSDDKLYITLNDIKGYLPVSAVSGLLDDPAVKGLASGIELPDLGGLLGGGEEDSDLLGTVFANCTMTTEDGITCIRLPFSLGEGINIDASIYIDDESMALQSITGAVQALGLDIKLNVRPVTGLSFPEPDETYKDLSAIAGFVPDALTTALGTTYGVKGNITIGGETIGTTLKLGIDAYIDRADGVAVDAIISVLGQRINVKYLDDMIYATVGNVGIKAKAADLPRMINAMMGFLGIEADGKFDPILELLPDTVGGWIGILQSLDVTDSSLTVGARVVGSPITLTLERSGGALSCLTLDADIDVLDLNVTADAKLSISKPAKREVKADGSYLDIEDVVDLMPYVVNYINAKTITLELTGGVKTADANIGLAATAVIDRANDKTAISADARLTGLGKDISVAYVNDVAYIAIGNARIKLAAQNAGELISKLTGITDALNVKLPDTGIAQDQTEDLISSAIGIFDSISLNGTTITIKAHVGDESLTVVIALALKLPAGNVDRAVVGRLTANGSIAGVAIDLKANVILQPTTLSAPQDASSYVDVNDFVPALDTVTDVIKSKTASATATFKYDKYDVTADIAVSISDILKARIDLHELDIAGMPKVSASVTVIDKTAYITVDGDIRLALTGSLGDIKPMLDKLDGIIPAEIRATIDGILDVLGDPDGIKLESIGSLLPAAPALPDVNDIDVMETINNALDVVKGMSMTDGKLALALDLSPFGKAVTVDAVIGADLSLISVALDISGKKFNAGLTGLKAEAEIAPPQADYVAITEFMPLIDAVMPFIDAEGYHLGVSATLFGTALTGDVYIQLPSDSCGFAITAQLRYGDVNVSVAFKDLTVYVAVSDIMVSCGASKEDILDLMETLSYAIPKLGEQDVRDAVEDVLGGDVKLSDIADKALGINAALGHKDGAVSLWADLSSLGIAAEITLGVKTADGALTALDISADVDGNKITAAVNVTVADGALTALSLGSLDAKIGDTDISDYVTAFDVTVKSLAAQTVTVSGEYVDVNELASFVKPVYDLINDAMSAKGISAELNAYILTAENVQTEISAKLAVNFDPIAVDATITIFANTESATEIYVKFVGDTLYLNLSDIRVSFNTKTDIARIFDIVKQYYEKGILPRYIYVEIGKLLGQIDGTSAFSTTGLLIDRLKKISETTDVAEIARLLMTGLDGLSGDSALRSILDMVGLKQKNGNVTIVAGILAGLSLNITPVAEDDKLTSVSVSANLDDTYISATVSKYEISDTPLTVAAPTGEELAKYLSLLDIIEVANNLINNFTTSSDKIDLGSLLKDEITFRISDFSFDYKVKDTVDEETGDPIVGEHIVVSNGTLEGKFVKLEDGGYDISLMAKLDLDMSSAQSAYGTLKLALYVVDATAYVDYYETKTGLGERVSIDFVSVMQMMAAVMKFMSVDPELIESLFGDMVPEIDTTVFDSMDIIGLDGIRKTIEDVAASAQNASTALSYLTDAWQLVLDADKAADPIEALRNSLNDDGDKKGIISYVTDAISMLGINIDTEPTKNPETVVFNGSEVKRILSGITLGKTGDDITATIDNNVTVPKTPAPATPDLATITVNQSKHGDVMLIDGFGINNLDINTGVLNVSAGFTAGEEFDIVVPEQMTYSSDGRDYSNLSNIKHLIFDVLNTANLKEFEIGGNGVDDKINLNIKVLLLQINVNIKYNVKVQLLDRDTRRGMGLMDEAAYTVSYGADGKPVYTYAATEPEYKTMAYIELNVPGYSLGADILPECTTRLYFYDDVFYLDGVDNTNWKKESFKYKNGRFFVQLYETFNYYTYERVYERFTLDEFTYMISADLPRFLDDVLFKLVPMSTLASNGIKEAINGDSGSSDYQATAAGVFNGYSYTNGEHKVSIDLQALTGNKNLSTLDASLIGVNDDEGDNNLKDNYMSHLSVSTSFVNIVKLNLDATLRNVGYVDPTAARKQIKSTGLSSTLLVLSQRYDVIDDNDNKQHVETVITDSRSYASIADALAGECTANTVNNPWTDIWQADYQAHLAEQNGEPAGA